MKIDFSKTDFVEIVLRGDRDCIFTLKPLDGEILSNLKLTFGIKGKQIGNEILGVDNLDGTFTFNFSAIDFEFKECVEFQIYGLEDYPKNEICIGKITYYDKIR